jgi:hypothetical protein
VTNLFPDSVQLPNSNNAIQQSNILKQSNDQQSNTIYESSVIEMTEAILQSNELRGSRFFDHTQIPENSDGILPSTPIKASQSLESHQIKATNVHEMTWNLIASDTLLSSFLFLQTISFRVTHNSASLFLLQSLMILSNSLNETEVLESQAINQSDLEIQSGYFEYTFVIASDEIYQSHVILRSNELDRSPNLLTTCDAFDNAQTISFFQTQTQISNPFFESDEFTASLYQGNVDEQSNVKLSIGTSVVASIGAAAGLGLLALMAIFFMKRRGRQFMSGDVAHYETEAQAIELTESDSENDGDDWDADNFDRAIESAFEANIELTQIESNASDGLFMSAYDELL